MAWNRNGNGLLGGASLLTMIAAGPAWAQVQPGSPQCPTSQDTVECSGDLGPGVLVTPPDAFTLLRIRNLTADIAPPAGRDGVRFVNSARDLTIEADAPGRSINVTGDGTRGIFAQIGGANLSISSNLAISTARSTAALDPALGAHGIYALRPAGTTNVTNSATIIANGVNSHAIFIDMSGAGADRIDLTNSAQLRVDASPYTVVSGASPSSAGIDLRMSGGSTLNLNNTGDIVLSLPPPVSGQVPEFLFGIRAVADGPNQNINITNSGDIIQPAGAIGILVRVTGNLDDAQETVVTRLVNSGDIDTGGNSIAIVGGSTYFENEGILRSSLSANAGSASIERVAGVDIRVAGFSQSAGATGRAFPAPSDLAGTALIEVVNRGTIESTGQTETSALHLVGYDINVTNSGSILANGTGGVFANAMRITALGDVRINSSGTIRSRSVGGPAIEVASYNAFVGDDDLTELVISGTVEATAENTAAVSLGFFAGSLLACPQCTPALPGGTGGTFEGRNNVTVEPGGRLFGGTGPGGAGLIFSGGRLNTLDNSGTVTSSSGVGVLVGTNSLSSELILNRGTIGSMTLEGGDDEVQLFAGGSFTGAIDAGSGTDTFRLEGGAGTSATFDFGVSPLANFELYSHRSAGTWTLTGDGSAAAGPWSVEAGTLDVDATMANSQFTVASGGTLAGTGAVGSTVVDGTLAPGGEEIGTLTVDGDLVFGPDSTFSVQIGSVGSVRAGDLVQVTGTAALEGRLLAMRSGTLSVGRHTILSAAGGISGRFDPFVTQGLTGGPTVEYDANNVVLVISGTTSFSTLLRDRLVFNTPTIEVRQTDMFSTRLIGRINGMNVVFDQSFAAAFSSAEVQAGIAQARAAITAAGGPRLIVLIGAPTLVSRTVTSTTTSASTFTLGGQTDIFSPPVITPGGPGVTVLNGDARSCAAAIAALPSGSRPACGPTDGGTPTAVGAGSQDVNVTVTTEYAIDERRIDTITTTTAETYELSGTILPVGSIHAAARSGFFDLSGRFLRRLSMRGGAAAGRGGWAEVYAQSLDASARGDIPAEDREARGLAGGLNFASGNGFTIGFAVDQGWLDLQAGATESADLRLTQLGFAGRWDNGRFALSLGAVYGFGEVDSRRDFMGASVASYDARAWGFAAEASYRIDAGGWRIAPVVSLDLVRLSTEAFAESGGITLSAAQRSTSRTRAGFGFDLGRNLGPVELLASVRYLALLDGAQRRVPVVFAVAPTVAVENVSLSERDSALLGLEARVPISPGVALFFGYGGRFSEGATAHDGAAGLTVRW